MIMRARTTYTYVELEVPPALYDFVAKALLEANYEHVFEMGRTPELGADCGPINMNGIALTRAPG